VNASAPEGWVDSGNRQTSVARVNRYRLYNILSIEIQVQI